MRFTSGQVLILIIWGSALAAAFVGFGLYKHWIEPAWLFAPLAILLGSLVSLVTTRVNKAITEMQREADQAKHEVAIERARSEIPPALQGAKIVAYRAKMPTLDDMSERPAAITETTVNIEKIEVKP